MPCYRLRATSTLRLRQLALCRALRGAGDAARRRLPSRHSRCGPQQGPQTTPRPQRRTPDGNRRTPGPRSRWPESCYGAVCWKAAAMCCWSEWLSSWTPPPQEQPLAASSCRPRSRAGRMAALYVLTQLQADSRACSAPTPPSAPGDKSRRPTFGQRRGARRGLRPRRTAAPSTPRRRSKPDCMSCGALRRGPRGGGPRNLCAPHGGSGVRAGRRSWLIPRARLGRGGARS